MKESYRKGAANHPDLEFCGGRREAETGTRKYHNKTIRGSFREAQTYLSTRLQERGAGRLPRAAAISFNQYLDQWLTTAAKPRLRPKSYADYEALLRLHIRPAFGLRPLGAIIQFDIQSIYAHMLERGLSPRTIVDQELFPDENGLGDHRTDAARTQESGKSSDDMDEKDDELAHLSVLARTANLRN